MNVHQTKFNNWTKEEKEKMFLCREAMDNGATRQEARNSVGTSYAVATEAYFHASLRDLLKDLNRYLYEQTLS